MPITLDGTNGITTPTYGGADTSEYLVPVTGFKNRIINGQMTIDQRNAGAAVTINATANTYTVDRWVASGQATDGVFTVDQTTDAPTGFINSVRIAVTTADASIGSDQSYLFGQFIEGFNVADLGFGTASAKTVTLSFWVRSSLTGTFGGALNNNGNDRNYPFTYTISTANTWEQKSITIAGDTTGTWLKDSGRGIGVRFQIGCGSNRVATSGAWTATSSVFGATGATNIISTLNATWDITGVQLEVGSTATSFDYRPYGTELALCQRYYYRNTASTSNSAFSVYAPAVNGTDVYLPIQFPVTMRTSPTSLETLNVQVLDGVTAYTGGTFAIDSFSNSISYAAVNYTHGSSVFTQYRTYGYRANNTSNAYLAFNAEL